MLVRSLACSPTHKHTHVQQHQHHRTGSLEAIERKWIAGGVRCHGEIPLWMGEFKWGKKVIRNCSKQMLYVCVCVCKNAIKSKPNSIVSLKRKPFGHHDQQTRTHIHTGRHGESEMGTKWKNNTYMDWNGASFAIVQFEMKIWTKSERPQCDRVARWCRTTEHNYSNSLAPPEQ